MGEETFIRQRRVEKVRRALAKAQRYGIAGAHTYVLCRGARSLEDQVECLRLYPVGGRKPLGG